MSTPIPNKLFTIYHPLTGRVIRTGSIRPVDEDLQAHVGEAILKGVRAEPEDSAAILEVAKTATGDVTADTLTQARVKVAEAEAAKVRP